VSVVQPTQEIKSYFTDTVEAALALARAELGEDAVLLGSRKMAADEGPGGYEVRFMATTTPTEAAPPPQDSGRLMQELAEMRRQIERMYQGLSKSVWTRPRWLAPSSALAELLSQLIEAEIDGELAQSIVDAVHARGGGEMKASWMSAAREELASRIAVEPEISADRHGRRVVALVGPPGAGKTTTLVKLAVKFGITGRRSVQLITTDDYRIGGADQLRSFAAILGVGFQVAGSVGALGQALEEHRSKELVLIDTPGIGLAGLEEQRDLAEFLARREEIDRQLVLMCSMRPADLWRVWEAYQMFRPRKLIFSRLDETAVFGGAYSLAARAGVPISFLATGQRIPEDLVAAEQDDIARRLAPDSMGASAAAA
jgi:flagellar biosynthesis protein FlhF